MKVVVFAPHPDDELIGCGGSIAKHVSRDDKVTVVYMTSGDKGGTEHSKEILAIIREREALEAAEFMGINSLIFLKNEDGSLRRSPEIIKNVKNIITGEKPQLIYIPHHLDGHKDHIITNKIVVEVIKKAALPCLHNRASKTWKVKSVLCYQVWAPLTKVSFLEDITEFVDIKKKALEFHRSQKNRIRYIKTVKNLYDCDFNKKRAKYFESFQVLKFHPQLPG